MLIINAHAKLNLYLEITGRRADGYHLLDMVMQSVDLCDTVSLSLCEGGGVQLSCSDPAVPTDGRNLACKAAASVFAATGYAGGANIHIEKRIPMGAGMGGGSADGAAVLFGLNELLGRPLSAEKLAALALPLGADVPFALTGGCLRAQGVGEVLTPLSNNMEGCYLLLKPKAGVNTAAAYGAYDAAPVPGPGSAACIAALAGGDIAAFGAATFNALLPAAKQLCPPVSELLAYLSGCADAAFMTGSGSTCVGVFATQAAALSALQGAPACAHTKAVVRPATHGLSLL
ncbi:MAG: 4-(cytidine 5'-diphospho)-2-C-methyl-D-erythritol kinase [Christensenellaceae bacterium]|nr:4-(cytidine 5'-diphospho)-2-C-methyl-D-erythritol kinase [Christensenellaceae bacterium]